MDSLLWIVGLVAPLFLGVFLFQFIGGLVRSGGFAMRKKFLKLGVLSGRTRQQIVRVVGPPNATTQLGDGRTQEQWLKPGYHIILIFNGNICEGVNHEAVS